MSAFEGGEIQFRYARWGAGTVQLAACRARRVSFAHALSSDACAAVHASTRADRLNDINVFLVLLSAKRGQLLLEY